MYPKTALHEQANSSDKNERHVTLIEAHSSSLLRNLHQLSQQKIALSRHALMKELATTKCNYPSPSTELGTEARF